MDILHNKSLCKFATLDYGAYLEYRLTIPDVGTGKEVMVMLHTFVPPTKRGSGVAGTLCNAAFKYAEDRGLHGVPQCSYIPVSGSQPIPSYPTRASNIL